MKEEVRDVLNDIFENHDQIEKISVKIFPHTRSITIEIEDLDDEWFNELKELDCQKCAVLDVPIQKDQGYEEPIIGSLTKKQLTPIRGVLIDNNAFAADASPRPLERALQE